MPGDPSKQANLTVLGGPMAGARLVLEEPVDNVLVGSDPSCRFCLPLPGVSPIHARIWIDANGVTVYDTNSPRGLYINDDRVVNQAPLRNGDILWLGTPGDNDVVMIQCRLAAQEEAPVGMPVLPEGTVDDSATVMMGAAAAEPPPAMPEPPAEATVMFDAVAAPPPSQDVFVEVTPEAASPLAPPDPISFETTLPPRSALSEFEDETLADQPALAPPEPAPFLPPEEPTMFAAPPPVDLAPPPLADFEPPI